jgi:hypothetical protein
MASRLIGIPPGSFGLYRTQLAVQAFGRESQRGLAYRHKRGTKRSADGTTSRLGGVMAIVACLS